MQLNGLDWSVRLNMQVLMWPVEALFVPHLLAGTHPTIAFFILNSLTNPTISVLSYIESTYMVSWSPSRYNKDICYSAYYSKKLSLRIIPPI